MDSKLLFDMLSKSSTTSQKTLMIDIDAVRNANLEKKFMISENNGRNNPEGALLKIKKFEALMKILN